MKKYGLALLFCVALSACGSNAPPTQTVGTVVYIDEMPEPDIAWWILRLSGCHNYDRCHEGFTLRECDTPYNEGNFVTVDDLQQEIAGSPLIHIR